MANTASGQAADRRKDSFVRVVASWRGWWRRSVVKTVDQAEVIAGRRDECQLTARYLFMLAMSAGIAILGLLQSSPAVVIGAMLLSPLMGPIMGLGFAIATGDFAWMRQASRSLLIGTALSIVLTALIVLLSPLQTVTPEIAARTRPNLFDLGIALFSALAGAYAMIRGQMGTVVGVAIATALMPPLAVVGFGLATLNWTVFSGALLLFFTNLMTIALTAALMARLYGFRTSLSPHQTRLQTALIVAAFVALAIPLGLSLRQIAWEATATRTINGAVLDAFDKRARLSQIENQLHAVPIHVAATVLTPRLRPNAEQNIERTLERSLGRPVQVSLTQYQVGTSAQAAEEAQLARAQAQEQADQQRAETIADRLALVAGVSSDAVLVDRERRTAVVMAKVLDGASLAAYRDLENRVAASESEWSIRLRPPARPLPSVAFEDGKPTDDGAKALKLIAWAGQRVQTPVILSGPEDEVAIVADALSKQGITVRQKPAGSRGPVTATWGAPDA